MSRFFLVLTLFPLFTLAQPGTAIIPPKPNVSKGFSIDAELEGIPAGGTVKLVNANTGAELASGTIKEKKITSKKNGKTVVTVKQTFNLKGEIAEPDLCLLNVGDLKPFNLYVENSPIKITGKSTDMSKWSIKGSTTHKDFQEFETTFTPLAQQLNGLATSINASMAGKSRDSLVAIYTATQQLIQDKIDQFITAKVNSYVSPFVLLVMMNFNSDPIVTEARFTKLNTAVQGSYLGKVLANQIADSKIGAVGTLALEFTQADTSGNPISLSSFRGKYVLVDFWASWCGPCRAENPNVVFNYQKFRTKNFTVLGVSLDKPGQKDKWIQAIKDDSLTWTHVSDLQFWNNEVAKLYHVQGIPQNILVDPSGKIIAKNLRGPALEAKLCEILGCN